MVVIMKRTVTISMCGLKTVSLSSFTSEGWRPLRTHMVEYICAIEKVGVWHNVRLAYCAVSSAVSRHL